MLHKERPKPKQKQGTNNGISLPTWPATRSETFRGLATAIVVGKPIIFKSRNETSFAKLQCARLAQLASPAQPAQAKTYRLNLPFATKIK